MIRNAAIRTLCQIIVLIVGSFALCLGVCLFLTVASGISFGDVFAMLNPGLQFNVLGVVLVFMSVVLFLLNLLVGKDDKYDE